VEVPHNSVHVACGWPLTDVALAAFHPIFFLLHSNVDRIHEAYLQSDPDAMQEFESHQRILVRELCPD